MLEPQNEHFVQDFPKFSHFIASKSTFSKEVSLAPQNLPPQHRCFVRGFRQFSAHISENSTPATEIAPCHHFMTMRFAQTEPQDASKVLHLPRDMMMEVAKVLRLPGNMQRIF